MASLKEFMQLDKNKDLLPTTKEQELAISAKLVNVLTVKDRNEVGTELVKLVNNDTFISELSDGLGKPQKGESEDEFVNRGKVLFNSLLSKRLSKS